MAIMSAPCADVAHAQWPGRGLLVQLDNDKVVWIDRTDIRYDRADGIVMTNLDRAICIRWPTNGSN